MSNTVVLRKVYAFDALTGNAISTGQTLVTDGLGGTSWVPFTGSNILITPDELTSTIGSLADIGYISTLTLTSTVYGSESNIISTFSSVLSNYVTTSTLNSTLTYTLSNYVTQPYLSNTLLTYVSTPTMISTLSNYITKPILSNTLLGYISTPTLSTILSSYVETTSLSNYISTATLSTVLAGYVSTPVLQTILSNYVSTPTMYSSLYGYVTPSTVSSFGYINVTGVNTLISQIPTGATGGFTQEAVQGYVLAQVNTNLQTKIDTSVNSAVAAKQATNVSFDSATTVNIANSKVTFAGSVSNLIYLSTFYNSSIGVTVNCNTRPMTAYRYPNSYDMTFSSITCSLSPFIPYINSNTYVTLDINPTFAFSQLGYASYSTIVLPISTMVQINGITLQSPIVTTFLYAGNTQVYQANLVPPTYINSYNIYSSPIRLNFPKGVISASNCNITVMHRLPSSIQNAGFQSGLHSNVVIPYFDTANSVFLTVQNIP